MTDGLKEFARKAAFAARKAAHAMGQGQATDMLAQVLARYGNVPVAGYMPIGTEIDPLAVMRAHAGEVCVPVVVERGRPLQFYRWTPDCDMVVGEFGIMVPRVAAIVRPQVLIVPLLSFDRRGYRLGYGGGFYDRTLAELRRNAPVTAIGFAFSGQEVEEVPIEPTDQPLDLIVTQDEVIRPG